MRLNSIKNLTISWFFIWLILSPVPEAKTVPVQSSSSSDVEIALDLRGGGNQLPFRRNRMSRTTNEPSSSNPSQTQTNSAEFRKLLKKHFPDWEARVSMEKRQGKIYHKALKKIKGYQRISPLLTNHQKWLTTEEKSSIDYFNGTGIYAKFQDPKRPPNIFDTRKSFLKKMENPKMRQKFLEAYNKFYPIEES